MLPANVFRTKILKDTPLVQLVEAFRNAEGQPRQRVVASLGDASIPEADKKSIARAAEDLLGNQDDLLDDHLSPEAAVWVPTPVKPAARTPRKNHSSSSMPGSPPKPTSSCSRSAA